MEEKAFDSRTSGTLGDAGREKLARLGDALGLDDSLRVRAAELFELMTSTWNEMEVGHRPPWPNDITDDGTPFEFSLAFEGAEPELRLLVESQLEPVSAASTWRAGLALNERLRHAGAHLDAFDRITGLFAPSDESAGQFSLWHGAALKRGRTAFKTYLNPQIRGAAAAPGLVEKALRRLGRTDVWEFVAPRLDPAGKGMDLRYVSLDLEDTDAARIKIYLARSSAADVEAMVRGARNVAAGDATNWLGTLTGSDGPLVARPLLTCFAFDQRKLGPTATLHVPVRCYAPHDQESFARIAKVMRPSDAGVLERALRAVANRSLTSRSGIITYASLGRINDQTRVTTYLAPECYPASGTHASGTYRKQA